MTPIVMIERAATIAAIITGCWKMRAMLGQLVKKGRIPRQKSAIPNVFFAIGVEHAGGVVVTAAVYTSAAARTTGHTAARLPDRLDEVRDGTGQSRCRKTRSETMAEDDETATARYIAGNVSTQLMLKVIIEIISTMADDPNKYRAGLKKKVLELADSMPLTEMDPARETKVRTFVRETIDKLLTNSKPD